MSIPLDWIKESKSLFTAKKPEHFTDFEHCSECAEHDRTLLDSSIDGIGLDALGNPGWDPLCFCSPEGLAYYFPALVRLSLETAENDAFYFGQLLFHLAYGGEENRLLLHFSGTQKVFVASFIEYMIATFPDEIEKNMCADEALRTHELWQKA